MLANRRYLLCIGAIWSGLPAEGVRGGGGLLSGRRLFAVY